MKTGIIIFSNDPETVWKAFRFRNFSLKAGGKILARGMCLKTRGVDPTEICLLSTMKDLH